MCVSVRGCVCIRTRSFEFITLLLVPVPLLANSWASSWAGSLRYHHWISKEYEVDPLARKAQGISISSPSLTVTSLGTSVNVAANKNDKERRGHRQQERLQDIAGSSVTI